MKYIKPSYQKEQIETNDIILISGMDNGPVTVEELSITSAKVSTSIKSIFGRIYD